MPNILKSFPVMPVITISSGAMFLVSASRLLVMLIFPRALTKLFDYTLTRYLSHQRDTPVRLATRLFSRPKVHFHKSRSPELSSTQIPQICLNPHILTLTRKSAQG